jgi:hypothetical protein
LVGDREIIEAVEKRNMPDLKDAKIEAKPVKEEINTKPKEKPKEKLSGFLKGIFN